MKKPRTFKELFNAEPQTFIKCIYDPIPKQIDIDVSNPSGTDLQNIQKILINSANLITYFSELESKITIFKRYYKRAEQDAETDEEKLENKRRHEDMLDKEKIVSDAKKVVDIQYRTVSKILSIQSDEVKANKMNDSIYGKRYK